MWKPIYNWTHKQWVRMVAAGGLFVVVAIVLRVCLLKDNSEAILATTAIIVLWYTVETWGLRWQMVLQNEIAIQPVVIARFVTDPAAGRESRKIILRNIGKGPALYVQPQEIEIASDPDCMRYAVKFSRIDCIEPGKEEAVDVGVYDVREGKEDYRMTGFIDSFDPSSANKSYDVTIDYEDIKGRKHQSVVRLGIGGNRLLTQGKV